MELDPRNIIKFNQYYQFDASKPIGFDAAVFIGDKIMKNQDEKSKDLPEKVAIKLCYQRGQALQRIFKERNSLMKLNSPGVVEMIGVSLIDFGFEKRVAICMQLMQGSLQNILRYEYKGQPIPEPQAVAILDKIVKAYKHIYKKSEQMKAKGSIVSGIIHGNLRPKNILYKKQKGKEENLVFKIEDLGCVPIDQQTTTNKGFYTPMYCSPQQFWGKAQRFTHKADIYAIGIIFLQMLNGQENILNQLSFQKKKNIQGGNFNIVSQKITRQELQKLQVSNIAIEFILNCLQQEQEDRYSWEDIFNHQIFKNRTDRNQNNAKIRFNKQYRFDTNSKLGEGTHGEVFKGHKIGETNFTIAVKVLHQNLNQFKEIDLQQKIKQLRKLKKFDQSSIVSIRQVRTILYRGQTRIAIAMQLMQGNLQQLMRQKEKEYKQIPQIEAKVIFNKIVKSYEQIYKKSQRIKKQNPNELYQDIVHCNIKPTNIFYKKEGSQLILKIGDLQSLRHQKLQISKNTNQYWSLQQTEVKGLRFTNKADVYAMGFILFQLLNGLGKIPTKVCDPEKGIFCVDFESKTLNQDVTRSVLKKLQISNLTIDLVIKCLKRDQNERCSWEEILNPSEEKFKPFTENKQVVKFGQCYQFNIKNKLGQEGTFGVVFRAQKKRVDRKFEHLPSQIAVKVIKKDMKEIHNHQFEQFHKQIKAFEELNSPGIVRMHKFGLVDYNSQKMMAIGMQLMQGTLQQILIKQYNENPIPEIEAVHILHKIVKSYRFIYEKSQQKKKKLQISQDIIHRDLKPANILFKTENGQRVFKIGDLGSIRNQNQSKTMTMGLFTVQYCSLQQKIKKKKIKCTNKADVYAIGVIFFQMLNGYKKVPSQVPDPKNDIYCVDPEDYTLDQGRTREVLKGLNVSDLAINFITNCLQKEQQSRYCWKDIFEHQIFKQKPFQSTQQELNTTDYVKPSVAEVQQKKQ